MSSDRSVAAALPWPSVAIIGAGPGGIAAARRVKQLGIENLVIFERGDGFGGVWRQNTYPGAACDISSYFYSFSFAARRDWSDRFAGQAELLDYFEAVARRLDLHRHLRARTAVTRLEWDAATATWTILASDGTTTRAHVVIGAVGMFSEPSYPDIPGRDEFAGRAFHSSRWDHDTEVAGRRVAVIGSGASAVQIVPSLAGTASNVTVYQRRPGWIHPKPDGPLPERTRWLFRHVPGLARLHRWRLWYLTERHAQHRLGAPALERRTVEALDYLDRTVTDPQLRARLRPDYPLGCTRRLPNNEWFPALQRDDVELVVDPIANITPSGIVTADGIERRHDAIVYATGFQATHFLAAIDVVGVGGQTLRQRWVDGVSAHLGLSVPGFPNLFMLYGPYTNGTTSVIHLLEAQARYVGLLMRRAIRRDIGVIDVQPAAYGRYEQRMQQAMHGTVWASGCGSYYLDEHGKVRTQYPGRFLHYWKDTWKVRTGDYSWTPRQRRDRPAEAAGTTEGAGTIEMTTSGR